MLYLKELGRIDFFGDEIWGALKYRQLFLNLFQKASYRYFLRNLSEGFCFVKLHLEPDLEKRDYQDQFVYFILWCVSVPYWTVTFAAFNTCFHLVYLDKDKVLWSLLTLWNVFWLYTVFSEFGEDSVH